MTLRTETKYVPECQMTHPCLKEKRCQQSRVNPHFIPVTSSFVSLLESSFKRVT